MRTIAVASGKGGAGKTSVSAALAAYLGRSAAAADCDVDAANLCLALGAVPGAEEPYESGEGYSIDASACLACGLCAARCRFGAVEAGSRAYRIDESACERCGACQDACPNGAVRATTKIGGALYASATRFGSELTHAELVPGEDTSGKLVRAVRRKAQEGAARTPAARLMIADAPPGIGCPVIASFSGVDLVVAVVEASSSGVRDAARLFELAADSGRPICCVVNKAGLAPEWERRAEELAAAYGAPVAARLPFDRRLREATERGEPWPCSTDAFVAELGLGLCRAIQAAARPYLGDLGAIKGASI